MTTAKDNEGQSKICRQLRKTCIIFWSWYNIKNLNKISVCTLLKTHQTKFEVIPPYDVGGDTVKPGFHYTANATTTTQKQSDYKVEQSSFTLISLF